jgi:hypothetical protein
MGRQPRLFAGLDGLDLEVAAIGDDIDILDIENGAGRLGCLRQQPHVHDLIGYGLRSGTRKTMIVALARKLLVALWRMVKTGEIPEGVILRPAA